MILNYKTCHHHPDPIIYLFNAPKNNSRTQPKRTDQTHTHTHKRKYLRKIGKCDKRKSHIANCDRKTNDVQSATCALLFFYCISSFIIIQPFHDSKLNGFPIRHSRKLRALHLKKNILNCKTCLLSFRIRLYIYIRLPQRDKNSPDCPPITH